MREHCLAPAVPQFWLHCGAGGFTAGAAPPAVNMLEEALVPFWLTFTPFFDLAWPGHFLIKMCAKVTPIGYTKSQHAPRIYRNLWWKAQNRCQKWIQGARKPQSIKNKNCCKMLQNVARCCNPLHSGTRTSHNLKKQRIEIPEIILKNRNTSSKQKFTVQRCKPESILQDVQHPFTGASTPLPVRGLKWHVLKRQRSSK